MRIASITDKLRLCIPYAMPLFAIAAWARVAFQGGFDAGWSAFQNPASSAADGRPVDFVVINLCVAASFILVAFGKIRLGNLWAFIMLALAGMVWIGMHA